MSNENISLTNLEKIPFYKEMQRHIHSSISIYAPDEIMRRPGKTILTERGQQLLNTINMVLGQVWR